MASNSLKLTHFCILVSLFNFVTTNAQGPTFDMFYCRRDKTTANSAFHLNLKTLFSSLSAKANASEFYNNTVPGRIPSDTVYGLFMCRGDVLPQLCGDCVANATQKLSSIPECTLSNEAVIWYQECMVRYSNIFFFSIVDTIHGINSPNTVQVSNQSNLITPFLVDTLHDTRDEAAKSGDRYATKQVSVSESQTLYTLAQCTQDLSPQNCSYCLDNVIAHIRGCCDGSQGAASLAASCNVRYELYPFYRVLDVTVGGLVPETNYPRKDSKLYSNDPGYLSHNCSNNESFTTDNGFQPNLMTLLSYLSSNASNGQKFVNTDVAGIVYGLFLCRDDVPYHLCGQCIQNASDQITSECRPSRTAIIWYNHCFLRYSNLSFFQRMDISPRFEMLNITNTSNVNRQYAYMLSNALSQMAYQLGVGVERYQTRSLKLNHYQTVYILAQCTPDLSGDDCHICLTDVMGSAIPWTRLGSLGGRVLYPSCNLRFELFQFYDLEAPKKTAATATAIATTTNTETRKGRSRTTILIVVPIIVLVILFSFGYYLIRRKRKTFETFVRENFGKESITLEPLQFDLSVIKAATNNFSPENKIGKGGFGEVYKGILIDGRHIAVKRLSRTSKQGAEEFKNEVLLIAKLQHRNLVALVGFCLEEQEKILIYEYVLNKSLNYFLFDTQQQKSLSWFERYKIIEGIARGILYLHEYSRLKIIHRDLKPSNILLDENMNPKISDFGLARMVEIDQDKGSTNKIVGTYGYMSPEYAMFGQFSDKSDVFSFGVMVLEIITGKKNVGSHESFNTADGLLSYVWIQWRDQTPLNIVDPKLKENYSQIEVIKCIQIGLLCVQENPNARPTMMTIVSYLSSHSIELPSPQQPAFFLQSRVDQNIVAFESSSSQSANNSIPLSINRMSTSEFHPR